MLMYVMLKSCIQSYIDVHHTLLTEKVLELCRYQLLIVPQLFPALPYLIERWKVAVKKPEAGTLRETS